MLDRRKLLISSLAYPALGLTGCNQSTAETIDDAGDLDFNAYIKLMGRLDAGTVFTSFQGTLTGITPESAPVPICRYQGLARSDWTPQPDGTFTKRSFDIGFFADLESSELIDEIINPLNGERVQPLHFQYGGGPPVTISADILPDIRWTRLGSRIWLTEANGGEFDHPMPMAKWKRESSGDKLYYRSETDYVTEARQLFDPKITQADQTLFWSSILSWEPWLLMGQSPGFSMWRGVGTKLKHIDDVPGNMQRYLAQVWPNYFDAEAPWDKRKGSFDRFMTLRDPR